LFQLEKRNCLLSLSTGNSVPTMSEEEGVSNVLPLLDIAMTNYMTSAFYQKISDYSKVPFFFYRFAFDLINEYSELDNSTTEYFEWFTTTVINKINEDMTEINMFKQRWLDPLGKGLEDE